MMSSVLSGGDVGAWIQCSDEASAVVTRRGDRSRQPKRPVWVPRIHTSGRRYAEVWSQALGLGTVSEPQHRAQAANMQKLWGCRLIYR